MVDQPLLEYTLFIILDIIIIAVLISFWAKREEIKQQMTDKRYESLIQKFIDNTINYHQSLIEVVKTIPVQQSSLIEKISDLQLLSIDSILYELKAIRVIVEEGNKTRDELAKCLTQLDEYKSREQ